MKKYVKTQEKTRKSRRKLEKSAVLVSLDAGKASTKQKPGVMVTLSTYIQTPFRPYRLGFCLTTKVAVLPVKGLVVVIRRFQKKSTLLWGIQDVDEGADPADNVSTGVNYQFMLCIHFPRFNESQGYKFTDFWSDLRPKAVAGRIEVTEAARGCLKLFRLFRQTGKKLRKVSTITKL